MNDLDDFRAALRQPPSEPFAEPDLTRIMADGTRIRRRRRVLTTTGGLAAAVVVVLVVVFAVQWRQPASVPVAQPPAPPSAASSVPPPTTATEPPPEPLGDVVGTGISTAAGEIVIFAKAVDEPQILPGIHFGLVAGFRKGGNLEPVLATNEFRGSDRSFGFHATDGGEVLRDQVIPVFGYFAGAATKITTTVHGKTVEAKLANWTADPSVVIFWFATTDVPDSASLTPLIAYDKNGNRLTK
ncbi:hypothetical protein VA596_49365 [Amycolatopsis sp., V23-08]|uniref:Uncharacterized protein n=1 Tax=Amycolatopsis heterodermiae TaxID=3110235 RepID=A0ABU5RMS7_9PSEU|nr:hypothetical protein [Amycolatopsis sp., V23-08]MEA5367618.1 hypothetical protein [Amycolatopsis sp., V23-08]